MIQTPGFKLRLEHECEIYYHSNLLFKMWWQVERWISNIAYLLLHPNLEQWWPQACIHSGNSFANISGRSTLFTDLPVTASHCQSGPSVNCYFPPLESTEGLKGRIQQHAAGFRQNWSPVPWNCLNIPIFPSLKCLIPLGATHCTIQGC